MTRMGPSADHYHHEGGPQRSLPTRDELLAERTRLRAEPRSPERSRAMLKVGQRLQALGNRSPWRTDVENAVAESDAPKGLRP